MVEKSDRQTDTQTSSHSVIHRNSTFPYQQFPCFLSGSSSLSSPSPWRRVHLHGPTAGKASTLQHNFLLPLRAFPLTFIASTLIHLLHISGPLESATLPGFNRLFIYQFLASKTPPITTYITLNREK